MSTWTEGVTEVLDEMRVFAAASPAGWGWAATGGDNPYPFPEHYRPARFHAEIAKSVVDVVEGRLDVLINTIPVQHGKTATASVLTASWFLGIHPEKFVIAISHGSQFAADRIGQPARDMLERHGGRFFDVAIDPRTSAKHRWNTMQGGGLVTFGIEKGTSGRRGDLLIVDDPYPSIVEASSKTFRDMVTQRYQFDHASRLAPRAGQIHTMSRFGDDDHVARTIKLCEDTGLRYRVLDFPALAICAVCDDYGIEAVNQCGHGVRDALGRLPGEALWPEVRPREFLLQQRKIVGSRAFDALYQGRPRPDGGLMFGAEWFRKATLVDGRLLLHSQRGIQAVPLSACRKFQMIDPATSTDPNAARYRIGSFVMTPQKQLVIMKMAGGTLGSPRAKALTKAEYLAFGPCPIGVEANGVGLNYIQDLIAEGMPIKGIKADRDKVTRASVATILYENERVFHLEGPWVNEMEEELKSFPGGAFKDQVDVISMASIAVSQEGASEPPAGIRLG